MRHWDLRIALFALAVMCLAATHSSAEVYVAEAEPGFIIRYDGTTGSVINESAPIPCARGLALDELGRLLIATSCGEADVLRFDPGTQEIEYLDTHSDCQVAEDVYPDQASENIYVIKNRDVSNLLCPNCRNFLGVLPGGSGPPDTIQIFDDSETLKDLQVRPGGPSAGNILVLVRAAGAGGYLAEFEKTGPFSYLRLSDAISAGAMTRRPTGFAITPTGAIVVVDSRRGLFALTGGGSLVAFGEAEGRGYADVEIGSDGMIYLMNDDTHRVERYDAAGQRVLPDLDGRCFPSALAAASFVPTPPGDHVFVEPLPGIQITYQDVTAAGFTTAVSESSTARVSPRGNYLPDCAELPGSRADHFNYIYLATDAVYRGLIQVDVLEEGGRLFYASGVGDTFRDFTITGTIDDARGTMPRFDEIQVPGAGRADEGPTEVVLVEDTRTDPQVTVYKFWRLKLSMEALSMVDETPCPWQTLVWLQKQVDLARGLYDEGDVPGALDELAILNEQLRDHAGWCIPDASDDPLGNVLGKVLAHSKTLMFSLERELGPALAGIGDDASGLSLSVTNPSSGSCRVALSGPVGTRVTLRIYSAAGRLISTAYEGRLGEGPEIVSWDGTDTAGRRVATGVYFLRATSEKADATSKIVYVR